MIADANWLGKPRPVAASFGQGNPGRVDAPAMLDWADLVQFVSDWRTASITHSDYLALPKHRPKGSPEDTPCQDWHKLRDPFTLFGICERGKRDDAHLLSRSAVTLDFDDADADRLLKRMRADLLPVPFAYLWHTTRSHDPEAGHTRLRVIVPLASDVTDPDAFRRLTVAVAAELGYATLDPASIKPAQMMFDPVHNTGAPFDSGAHEGDGYLRPDAVLAALPEQERAEQRTAVARVAGRTYDAFEDGDRKTRLTLDEAEAQLLEHLSADVDNDDWVKVGMALHWEFDGSDEALDLWDRWSEQCAERYAEGECAKRWRSFRLAADIGRKPLTLRTFIKSVRDGQKYVKHDRVKHWAAEIGAADDRATLYDDLPERIRRDPMLDAFGREELAQKLAARMKAVTGAKPKIDALRVLLKPEVSEAEADEDAEVPGWVKEWVYVTVGDTFFSLEEHIEVSRAGFNARYDRLIAKDDEGNPRYRAADGALQRWNMRVVTRIDYNPLAGPIYTVDGVPGEFVNRYDPDSVPMERAVHAESRDIVLEHVALLLPDAREQQLLLNWLAYVVQHPGVKVRWAVYLCGPEGDGKSFFCNLLQAVMGLSNVNILAGSQFESSSFTDWAVGQSVMFIEEMKLHGHNRFDAANRLKPYVTNPMVPVHPKGRPAYTALNTTQYFITSNHMDGVPVSSGDRRYMFLRTRFNNETLRQFRLERPDYYKRLFGALEMSPGGLRRWLLRYDAWHPDFDPDGNAPLTQVREQVVELAKNDIDSVCEAVVREKPPGVLDSWIASGPFINAVQRRMGDGFTGGKQRLGKLVGQWLSTNHWRYLGGERHRVGPEREPSYFWTRELVDDVRDWWKEIGPAMLKSFNEFDDGDEDEKVRVSKRKFLE